MERKVDKIDLTYLDDFPRALQEVAKVMYFGATKYERGSWLRLSSNEMRPSERRHSMAISLGETIDKESGLSHLAHKAARVLMELELKLLEEDMVQKVEDLWPDRPRS